MSIDKEIAVTEDKGLYAGLMRLHILHEAEQQVVCGAWVTDQLRQHGYEINARLLAWPIGLPARNRGRVSFSGTYRAPSDW